MLTFKISPLGVSKLLLNTATQQNHIRQSISIRRSAKNTRPSHNAGITNKIRVSAKVLGCEITSKKIVVILKIFSVEYVSIS